MTVKLYKNSKVDGITRLGLWTDKATQTAYFDTLTSKTYNVNTVGLGTPLRINDKLNNLLGYGYGYIDYGDGFRYYFAVADLSFVTETITDISYTLDCYDTAITQTNVNLARATITRYPSANALETYPYTPPAYHYEYFGLGQNNSFVFLAVVNCRNSSGNNSTQFMALFCPTLVDATTQFFINAYKTAFAIGYTFEEGDIYNISIATIYPDFALDARCQEYLPTSDEFAGYKFYLCNADTVIEDITSIESTSTFDNLMIIQDMKGNEVFSLPPNQTMSINAKCVAFSASSIMIYLRALISSGSKTDEVYIPIPTESLDVYVDAYKEYYYRQRAIDIEARNLQINQSLYANLLGSGTSGISGAIGGGMAGVGAGMGAIAGVAIGVASSVGNYAIESYYSPKIQNLKDTSYRNLAKTISNAGNAVHIWINAKMWGIWKKQFDGSFTSVMQRDTETDGYFIYDVTANFASKIVKGPITADVEVLGDIPIAWKEQIHNRFASGVKIV